MSDKTATADLFNREVSTALDGLGKLVREREAARVIQLPLWSDAKRGTPNSFIRSALFSAIQSKDRKYLKEAILYSQQGISIKFTGEQLNQEDLTLWETLAHFAKRHPLGHITSFTAHSLLKAMGLHTGGDEHRRLHSGILRLTACAVEVTHEHKTYFGPLIKSGAKDEITSHYAVELNRDLIRLYGETQWTAIDWQQRRLLARKPLAQALHAYYSSHRYPYPVTLDFLRKLTGSRNEQMAGFKRLCRAALEELVRIEFLQSFNFEDDMVVVKRAPSSARADD